MSTPSSAARRALAPPEDLNLVPIMNLVVCLIPMVLFGASFTQLGVVDVHAPRFSPNPTPTPGEPLDLTLAIGHDGFRLSAAKPLPDAAIPKRDGEYDFVALYNAVVRIKADYPEESTFRLTADADIAFGHLIRVMDTVRVRLAGSNYDNVATFRAAAVSSEVDLLWPDVAFAVVE